MDAAREADVGASEHALHNPLRHGASVRGVVDDVAHHIRDDLLDGVGTGMGEVLHVGGDHVGNVVSMVVPCAIVIFFSSNRP